MAEQTVREQMAEALEDAATALHADRKHDGRFKHCERWGCYAARAALDRARAEPEDGSAQLLGRLLEHHQRAHGADQTGHNLDCCISLGEDQPGLCTEANDARAFLQDREAQR